MKITEVTKPLTEAPTTFVPTHYGGAFGANKLMAHSDGKIYWMGGDRRIQPWQGNPNADGILGRFNPATVRGKIVNGRKVPYGPGENFANDPTNRGPQASTWKNPDAQPQAAKPVTGAKYDQGLLRRGSRGAGVKELQAKLGMPKSEQDGIFGPKTEAAVKKLQQSQGIKVDGIVGPETRATIAKLQAPEDNKATVDNPPVTRNEPTPTEPEVTEPEVTEPEVTEPEVTEPEVTEPEEEPDTSANDNQSSADDAQNQNDADFSDPEPEELPDAPVESGLISAETIADRLSPDSRKAFTDDLAANDGDILATLVQLKYEAMNAMVYNPADKKMRAELFGITSKGTFKSSFGMGGREVNDVPGKGVISWDSVPTEMPKIMQPGPRGRAIAKDAGPGTNEYDEILANIKYKSIDDMEESRILDLAGVNMKKLDEEITISGSADDLIRMMQLAGASGAKAIDADDINPKPMPMPTPGGCGSKPKEPGMSDMIKMMSTEEEGPMGDEYDDDPSSPADNYADPGLDTNVIDGDDLHKQKTPYPPTASKGDNPMALEDEIKERLMKAFETYKDRDAYDASQQSGKKVTLPKAPWEKDHDAEKGEKPDYADLDGDGNEDEAMKDAAKDKKDKMAALKKAGNAKADAEAAERKK